MKAKGCEIRDFWNNYWPEHLEDWYFESDDGEIQVEDDKTGEFLLKDDKIYNLNLFGPLGWQGKGESPVDGQYWEFQDAFKQYKKATDKSQLFVICVPFEDIDDFKKLILNHENWKMV